jgi:hypothetical protein
MWAARATVAVFLTAWCCALSQQQDHARLEPKPKQTHPAAGKSNPSPEKIAQLPSQADAAKFMHLVHEILLGSPLEPAVLCFAVRECIPIWHVA